MTAPYGEGINTSTEPWSILSHYVRGDDGSVPGLLDRTQPNIMALLQTNLQGSANWTGSTAAVFDGLETSLGLPLAIIAAIVKRLFGIDLPLSTVTDALGVIQRIVGMFELPSLLSLIPASSIGAATPNLLYSGNFEDADTISGDGVWTWASNGIVAPGAVKVVANGTLRRLYSNAIPVAPGQQMSLSVQTKWDTLTATGSPIVLALTEYLTGQEVNGVTIASVASPAAAGDPTTISGAYTVPDNIDEIRIRLEVLATATAGNVYFDDAQARKTGLMSPDLVTGLSGLFANFSTLIDGIYGALTGNAGSTGIDLDTLFSGLDDFRGTVSSQIDQLINLLTQIISVVSPITAIPTNPFDIITTAISIFASWWGVTTSVVNQAQTAATQTAANTAAILAGASGGTSVTDLEFNTVQTNGISSNYTTFYTGNASAGGNLAADGLGNVMWIPGGGFPRNGFARHTTPLTTDNFEVQIVLEGAITAECFIYILARAKSDLTEWAAMRIGPNSAAYGQAAAFSNGGFTVSSSPVTITSNPGDSFIFRGGYADSGWHFKLLQNNQTIIDYVDNGHNSLMDSTHRGIGFGMTAPLISGVQVAPPKIASLTAADRATSAP